MLQHPFIPMLQGTKPTSALTCSKPLEHRSFALQRQAMTSAATQALELQGSEHGGIGRPCPL